MKASDIAKLATSVATGVVTYEVACNMLDDDGEVSTLDKLIAGGAGLGVAAATSGIVSDVMDATGVSDVIDSLFDF